MLNAETQTEMEKVIERFMQSDDSRALNIFPIQVSGHTVYPTLDGHYASCFIKPMPNDQKGRSCAIEWDDQNTANTENIERIVLTAVEHLRAAA